MRCSGAAPAVRPCNPNPTPSERNEHVPDFTQHGTARGDRARDPHRREPRADRRGPRRNRRRYDGMSAGTRFTHRCSVTRRRPQLMRRWRVGGAEGNEILTSAAAVVLVGLLIAEGITIVHMRGLLSAHMFIGLVLIPPVVLKLASTGYRM